MSNNTPPPLSLLDLPAWQDLTAHYDAIKNQKISHFFDSDKKRFDSFHIRCGGLLFDYSKHLASQDTMALLMALAEARDLQGQRERMFNGEVLNTSEDRAVLHMALRGSCPKSLMIDGENVAGFVNTTKAQIKEISTDIRGREDITDVINIGIGGSDLGPHMACRALRDHADGPRVHFLSNVDGHDIHALLKTMKPENTVFIIASKTFTTLETMTNARSAKAWITRAMGADAVAAHFYALSTNIAAANDFGIATDNILPLRDWVGGRYSVWGAIGLSLAVAIGFDGFQSFLDGAHAMDTHFMDAPLDQNIPVIMGLLGVWYNNFCGYQAHCLAAYAQDLALFSPYIQQLDMESNGKRVTRDGERVYYATGPVIFGEPGTNGQHAFFQLLHQGTQIIPTDFIGVIQPTHDLDAHHHALLGNMLAQSQALMEGKQSEAEPHRHFDGNRPSSTLLLDRLDPYHLGMLMALYEHKVFVQGALWGINSFDQWGVELGKVLAGPITDALQSGTLADGFDGSTQSLITEIFEKFIKS